MRHRFEMYSRSPTSDAAQPRTLFRSPGVAVSAQIKKAQVSHVELIGLKDLTINDIRDCSPQGMNCEFSPVTCIKNNPLKVVSESGSVEHPVRDTIVSRDRSKDGHIQL